MHEASLAADLVRKAEAVARAEGAERITTVTVRIGALAHVTGEHLAGHFAEAARGSLAEGARVESITGPDDEAALDDPNAADVILLSVEVEGGPGDG
jgi:hydrogenase nickel incorporation protein HypA/HybF